MNDHDPHSLSPRGLFLGVGLGIILWVLILIGAGFIAHGTERLFLYGWNHL